MSTADTNELTREVWSTSGSYLYLSNPDTRAEYTHFYYIGLRFGHGEPRKLSAYIIKSTRKLTPFDILTLKPYLVKTLLNGQPMEIVTFNPIPSET